MDLASLAQILNPLIQTLFIVIIIGLGYYYTLQRPLEARSTTRCPDRPLPVAGP